MPVLVIADLHLDFWLRVGRDPLAALSSDVLEALDALIIAGDLSNKPKVRWPHMLRHVRPVDFHPEVTRVLHRELTRLKVMFCGLCWGQGMRGLPFRFGYR